MTAPRAPRPRPRAHTPSGREIPATLARHLPLERDEDDPELEELEDVDPYTGGIYERPRRSSR